MSVITECDNCGQQERFKAGSHAVPYGHDGAIQWMTGGESRSSMLVMNYICKDCRTAADVSAEEARSAELQSRKKQPS